MTNATKRQRGVPTNLVIIDDSMKQPSDLDREDWESCLCDLMGVFPFEEHLEKARGRDEKLARMLAELEAMHEKIRVHVRGRMEVVPKNLDAIGNPGSRVTHQQAVTAVTNSSS
jgi:hypothetical protein